MGADKYDAKNSSNVNRLREIFGTQNADLTIDLIRNLNTPTDVLSQIVDTTNNEDFILIICEHPNADVALLTKIWDDPKWDSRQVKIYVASNPECPEKFFLELIEWDEPKTSYYLAGSDATPTSVLTTMFSLYQNDKRFSSSYKSVIRALFYREALPAPYTDWPLEWMESHFTFSMNPYERFNEPKH